MRAHIILAVVLALGSLSCAQDPHSSILTLPLLGPPSPIAGGNAQVVGGPGNATYFYWIVANYAVGSSTPAGPFIAFQAPSALSATRYVSVSWVPAVGASTYDVLRTLTAAPPSGACGCAVAIGTAAATANDTGAALGAYTVATFDPNVLTLTLANEATGSGASHLKLRQNGALVIDLSIGGTGTLTNIALSLPVKQVLVGNGYPDTLASNCTIGVVATDAQQCPGGFYAASDPHDGTALANKLVKQSGTTYTITTGVAGDQTIPTWPVALLVDATHMYRQVSGSLSLIFSTATTAGNYVLADGTGAGTVSGTSATCPAGKWYLGTVKTTNGAGGTYDVNLAPGWCPGGGGAISYNPPGGPMRRPSARPWSYTATWGNDTTLHEAGQDRVVVAGTPSSPAACNGTASLAGCVVYTSATTANATAGWTGQGAGFAQYTKYGHNGYFAGEWTPSTTGTDTGNYYWAGMSGSNTATVLNADAPAASIALFRYKVGTDTNWKCTLAAGGANTSVDSGIAVSTANTQYLEVWEDSANSQFHFYINGAEPAPCAPGTMSQANRPTTGSWSRLLYCNNAATGVACLVRNYWIYGESDVF